MDDIEIKGDSPWTVHALLLFEINVEKRRIRHGTTLEFGSIEIEIQNRSMSVPTLSDIDFKNKLSWVWTTLNFNPFQT